MAERNQNHVEGWISEHGDAGYVLTTDQSWFGRLKAKLCSPQLVDVSTDQGEVHIPRPVIVLPNQKIVRIESKVHRKNG